jgi:general secretion pathway protein D
VPILGSIPVLGALFRSRSTDKVKTNLMVFIRPKILRNSSQMAIETDAKYNSIRDLQRKNALDFGDNVSLMPGEERLMLPPIETLRQPSGPVIDLRDPSEAKPSEDSGE